MAEQRQPFRFRIPWLPGASAPARSPAEPTQRPVVEPLAAAERVPFQPIARPPFRPAGIAQVSPPPSPPKAPSPPRKAPQPPSPPRAAPESSLPLQPTSQPEEVIRRDAATPPPPVPSQPEIPPAVMSQSQPSIGVSPEGNLKSDVAESISGTAQPKETQLPSFLGPESSNVKPAKPVASDSLSDLVKADPPKASPSTPSGTSLLTSVDQPPPDDLQSRETLALVPAQRLAADKKPTEPLLSALVPSMAKADPLGPSSLEVKVLSQPSLKDSSPTAVAQPLLESQPKENSSLQPFVLKVADEKPVTSIDSASVPKSVTANHQEPAPLVPPVVPLASPVSSSFRSISRPTGESQGPFHGTISKLQEDKGIEATDKAETPTEAADSVASSGKAKEKESTRPIPPLPKKQSKGPLPLASSSNEQKRMKLVRKKRVALTGFHHSNTNHLESHPRPGAARGSGPPSLSLQEEIKDDMSKFVHSITSGKANMSTIQESVDVITLAGENTGATMHLTSGLAEREERIHIHRNYRSNPDESIEGTTDVEEEEWEVDGAEDEESDNSAFLNCNVQGVNNSLVLDSSVSEGSPGVHLEWALNTEPQSVSRSEAFKNEVGITPAEKHVYKPTIRRRCLRGLFLGSSDESSNDDKDNPTKPRRHGCRFGYD
ncbi:hypothetical protein MLD38_034964 [Melastoma candidum]|uniref:Uncharacterized protein n=1 Tax=Melastoma candidum TaxID=119954 RepID=A0ACB9MCZ2_9MYRT|nr:hypothetical protein MLD38_034964 [Melastoma candidum]